MNNYIDNFMYKIRQIVELQRCVADVMENTINNKTDNSHVAVLVQEILNKLELLYSELDEYSLHC